MMPSLRHLQFVQSLEPLQGGGLGAAARQLHAAMSERGLESQLFATQGKDFREEWPGVDQFVRCGPAKAFYAPGLAAAAEASIRTESVVHGHGFYVYPNWVFGRLARKRRLPFVYHVHGIFEPWILRRSRFKKRIARWLFEDANFKHAKLWRALTHKEADQIRAVVGPAARIVVAPNGMDLGATRLARFSQPTGRRRALFLGRLHPKKGLDLLVRAWAGIGPTAAEWELVIAGPDEGGHEVEVRRWVEAAGLDGSVTFTGSVSGSAKYELLASADLFVLTSYSEGLPMAPLEAMASGVPVAITHECNLPEVAQAGAGWLCAAEPAAVGRMLLEAFRADDTERQQRGVAGRRLVEAAFTWQKTVATLHEACQQMVQDSS